MIINFVMNNFFLIASLFICSIIVLPIFLVIFLCTHIADKSKKRRMIKKGDNTYIANDNKSVKILKIIKVIIIIIGITSFILILTVIFSIIGILLNINTISSNIDEFFKGFE